MLKNNKKHTSVCFFSFSINTSMRYVLLLLIWSCFPTSASTLDLDYQIEIDWNYCELHKEECDRIANYDHSILPELDMSPAITNKQWAMFITLQLADIYSTYKGLQYDCVKELNPFLGESPSVTKMFVTKTAVLTPAIRHDMGRGNLHPKSIDQINMLMTLVVANNYDVYRRSKRNCTKIR